MSTRRARTQSDFEPVLAAEPEPADRLTAGPAGAPALLRYAADPLAFVRDVLCQDPWEAQERVLLAVRDHPRTTVRSSHGVGKTWVAACAALWWVYSHQPSLVLSTAPTARQVEALLWAEIHRLWHRANARRGGAAEGVKGRKGEGVSSGQGSPLPPFFPSPLPSPLLTGRCLRTRLEVGLDQTGIGLTTTEPERFAGWHCAHLLVIVDEASGVPDRLYEVLQGTLTSAHCRLLLIGNPTRTTGFFHASHHKGDWHRLKISAYDTPNFGFGILDFGLPDGPSPPAAPGSDPNPKSKIQNPKSELPCPWLVTPEWVEARRLEWGEDSDPFRVRVLGEFPRNSSDALIQLEWVEAAEARRSGVQAFRRSGPAEDEHEHEHEHDPSASDPERLNARTPERLNAVVLGVDVARYGDCETVVALRRGDRVAAIWAWQGADLMHTCGRVLALAREHAPARIVVDAVGMGAGLLDRLLEIQQSPDRQEGSCLTGCELVGFQSGARPWDPEQHYSRRDEAYLALRDRLRDGDIAFAEHWSPLVGQLCSLKYGFTSRGQLKVESKDDRRRRGEPSPDWADAVALAFAPVSGPFCLPLAAGSQRPNPLPMPSLQGRPL